MGQRGPQPKRSVEEQIMRGNPGKRKIVGSTDAVAAGDELLKPTWLKDAALEYWDDLTSLIKFNTTDAPLLADYCSLLAESDRCQSVISEQGVYKKSQNGHKTRREEFVLLKELRKELLKVGNELGLTPKSRRTVAHPLKQQDQSPASAKQQREKEGSKYPIPPRLQGIVAPPRPIT